MAALDTLDEHNVVQRSSDEIIATNLGEEQILMNIDVGEYFGLNPLGRLVFSLLDAPRSVREIVDVVVDRYGIERERAVADVVAFVREMEGHRLVTVA